MFGSADILPKLYEATRPVYGEAPDRDALDRFRRAAASVRETVYDFGFGVKASFCVLSSTHEWAFDMWLQFTPFHKFSWQLES